MEGVELSLIFSGLVLCIACNRSPTCYNTRMTNHHDQLNLVRTRNRQITTDNRFIFQTVWSFSPDGINTETYVVSAVVTIPDESICETYVFPARDEYGEYHSYAEVHSSPHFLGHHSDHTSSSSGNTSASAHRINATNLDNGEKTWKVFSAPLDH